MHFSELQPLIDKVAVLETNENASIIYQDVMRRIELANSPINAKRTCEYITSMTHPKAWGDRFVEGYDLAQWSTFLVELSNIAQSCRNQISTNHDANRT